MGSKMIPVLSLILYLALHSVSVGGFSLSSTRGCDINSCSRQFRQLRTETDGNNDRNKACLILRTYWRCIRGHRKQCKGDLNYLSVRSGVRRRMRRGGCSTKGGTVSSPQRHSDTCTYRHGDTFSHCGLFGDPHLNTFSGDFQTCKIEGAWPLVENKHLLIQVTNDHVRGGSTATATSKITVIIKRNPDCGSHNYILYEAKSGALPSSFHGGTTHHGPTKAIQITPVSPHRHVEIYIRYIATTIRIRRLGRYYTFAIRTPQELVNRNQNRGLCERGCPSNERIDYRHYLVNNNHGNEADTGDHMTRSDAMVICREAAVIGDYFDSCVFDLMTTGDSNFTSAAMNALVDLRELHPLKAELHVKREDFTERVGESRSGSNINTSSLVLILIVGMFNLL